MTLRRHHVDQFDGYEVWYYEDDEQPGVFRGIRGNPTDDQLVGHVTPGPVEPEPEVVEEPVAEEAE